MLVPGKVPSALAQAARWRARPAESLSAAGEFRWAGRRISSLEATDGGVAAAIRRMGRSEAPHGPTAPPVVLSEPSADG